MIAQLKISLFITLLLTATIPVTVQYSGGTGTEEDPYQIASPDDLQSLSLTPADSQTINCYSTATVTGEDKTGGLVGENSYFAIITDCYASGEVNSDAWFAGGLAGLNRSTAHTVNCFFDKETNGKEKGIGMDHNGQNQEVTGLETIDFDDQIIFEEAGWQFGNTTDAPWKTGMAPDGRKRPVFYYHEYTVTFLVDTGGQLHPESHLVQTVRCGNHSDSITAVANYGWIFKNWQTLSGDSITNLNPLVVFNVTSDTTLVAVFQFIDKIHEIFAGQFSVSPNPAKTFISFNYRLPANSGIFSIEIRNLAQRLHVIEIIPKTNIMKKVIFYLLFLTGFQPVFGQSQMTIPRFSDSIKTVQERNFYRDTLWVMDSVYFYYSIDYNLQLTGIYKVLTRDERGNKLTALGTGKRISGYFENTSLDSVVYFEGTNDVHYSKTYAWNSEDQKWMDNQYRLYDEDSNLIEYYDKGWNLYENKYGTGTRSVRQFENGLLTSVIYYHYLPESGFWEPDEKGMYNYNEYGKDTLNLIQRWHSGTETWINEYKIRTYYNEKMNPGDLIWSEWDTLSQNWVYQGGAHYFYNEDNLLNLIVYEAYNEQENQWRFYGKTVFSYNTSGQVTERLYLLLDSGEWVNRRKYVFAYEVLQNETTRFEWDTIAEKWQPVSRDIYSHNTDSTLLIHQTDVWDSLIQQLAPLFRTVDEFDVRRNITREKREHWVTSTETWITDYQADYFWSPFRPLQVPEYENIELKVYPNPAKSSITFSYGLPPGIMQGEIEIRNTAGQTIAIQLLKQAEGKVVFDARNMPAGIYIYTLKSSQSAITGKVVIVE